MKVLLLFAAAFIVGILFISAATNHPRDLSNDKTFVNTFHLITSLPSCNQGQYSNRVEQITVSMDDLRKRYTELNNYNTAGTFSYAATEKLMNEKGIKMHGDSCVKNFIRDVFSCFSTCKSHADVKTCLATACANYQVCLAGGPR